MKTISAHEGVQYIRHSWIRHWYSPEDAAHSVYRNTPGAFTSTSGQRDELWIARVHRLASHAPHGPSTSPFANDLQPYNVVLTELKLIVAIAPSCGNFPDV